MLPDASELEPNWKPGDPIGYVRSTFPDFQMPSYDGERYEALVPDTLDLAERARLAIHAMTENPNPEADYEVYWRVKFTPVPTMLADFSSPTLTPKFQEAVVLNRLMSGSDQNLHVDRRWMEVTLLEQGDDGLFLIPIRGRPWAMDLLNEDPSFVAGALGGEFDPDSEQVLSPFVIGQLLRTVSLYAARDGGPVWEESIRRAVDGLIEIAVDRGDYAFFWPGPLWVTEQPPTDATPRFHYHMAELSLVYWGLVRAYEQIGYEPALTLAGKLIVFHRDTFFAEDGAFVTAQRGAVKGHVHAHARGLRAMADYALQANDDELLEFVVKSYTWARARLNTLIGFAPNHVPGPEWRERTISGELDEGESREYDAEQFNPCEVAGLATMLATAVRLSEAGIADCWDDIDRWTRNMLAESQLLSVDWARHLPGSTLAGESVAAIRRRAFPTVQVGPGQTTDRVLERNLGSWPTEAAPNDWYDDPTGIRGFVHGDTANAARAIYWIWDRIVTHSDGALRVNLLLNRASRWADVDSYIPYEGRVDIKVKQPVELAVRIPEWVRPAEARAEVNGEARAVSWDGRYARLGAVRPGETATVTFPLPERTDLVGIQKRTYTLVRRGNDVVDIFPRGRYYPFYRREHYRSGQTRWRKLTRFVSNEQIAW